MKDAGVWVFDQATLRFSVSTSALSLNEEQS